MSVAHLPYAYLVVFLMPLYLSLPTGFARERSSEHNQHSNNQDVCRGPAQWRQRVDEVYQRKHDHGDGNTNENNHITHNKIVDGLARLHGRTSSCSCSTKGALPALDVTNCRCFVCLSAVMSTKDAAR